MKLEATKKKCKMKDPRLCHAAVVGNLRAICMQMSMRIFHPWFKVLRNPLFRTSRLRIQPTEQNLGLGYFVGQIRLHENCLQIF